MHPIDSALPFHIALTGPTAAGKTAAALAVAKEYPAEIISVDSALVYRGMNIGTAKPRPEELEVAPHHLIDIRDPLNPYSAAEFARDARRLMHEITARNKLPLLVGGTMLYYKALYEGLNDMPGADPMVRAEIEAQALQKGWPAMHAALSVVDPGTAARLSPNDSQRIQRALEVYRLTGTPLSQLHVQRPRPEPGIQGSGESACLPNLFSLEPLDRSWLHARIARRFDAMLAEGFLDEVQSLRERGDLHRDLPSIRCVGYRQAWEALDGLWPMKELRDRSIFATRQLAKRQITWLRSMPNRSITHCDQPDALERLVQLVRQRIRLHV